MDFKARLPGSLKAVARPFVWRMSDAMAKKRGDLMPPRRLTSQVPGNFQQVGAEFSDHFRNLGGLLPDHRVLDIGCGPGRMALPLTGFLSTAGSYEGVDTWSEAVDWCVEQITPRFGNFRFRSLHTDVNGGCRFPYEDGEFDFAIVCAISRLDAKTYRSYVLEAGRILRTQGVYFGTCFISDSGPHDSGPYASGDRGQSARGDAPKPPFVLSEDELGATLASAGLKIESVHRGAWAGHPAPLSYQDVVVAVRS
jgi:SAM-dependent methyltransferase